MQVEHVDFVSVPTRDLPRALAFYREVLGLPESEYSDGELETPNVTLSFWNPETDGEPFQANNAGLALRVDDVEAAVEEFRAAGGEVIGIQDSGVCHMGVRQGSRRQRRSSSTAATRRRRSVSRTELLERYRALPMPTTTDESWRFTDLKGFDPDAFVQNGHVEASDPGTMLEIDVAGSGHGRRRHRDRARAGGDPLRATRRVPSAVR